MKKYAKLSFLFIAVILLSGCGANKTGFFSEPYVKNTELISGKIYSIVEAESNPKILYMSADIKEYGGKGVFKSVDEGKTWKLILSSKTGAALTIEPTNPDIVYFAEEGWSNAFIYKTTDGGSEWKKVKELCYVSHMFFKESVIHAVYHDKWNPYLSITHSTDHGINWATIKSDIKVFWVNSFVIDKSGNYYTSIFYPSRKPVVDKEKSEDGKKPVFQIIHENMVYRSTDNSASWEKIKSIKKGNYDKLLLHKSIRNDNILYTTGPDGFEISKNDGNTWKNISSEPIQSSALTSKDNIYAITGNSLLFSSNKGKDWKELYDADIKKTGEFQNLYLAEQSNIIFISTKTGSVKVELGKQKGLRLGF